MPWVRIDDHFDQNQKIAAAGPLGMALWTAGLAYCNRQLTDGFIPRAIARTLLDFEVDYDGRRYQLSVTSGIVGRDVDAEFCIGLLLENGLWDEVDGGYLVHDYADFQPTREQVIAEREGRHSAKAAGGKARAAAAARDDEGRFIQQSIQQPASSPPAEHPAADQQPSSPVPVPVPVPVPIRTDTHIRAVGFVLTTEQRGVVDALHDQVHRLVYGGAGYPDPGWCEDLIRRGATLTDVDHSIQNTISRGKRSSAYVRAILEGRVQEREQGRDPDAISAGPSSLESGSYAGKGRARSVAPTGDGAHFSNTPPEA